MKLVTRITALAGGAVVFATAASIACVGWIAHGNRVNELRGLMSAAIQQAETVTENMDYLHRAGSFKHAESKSASTQGLDRSSAMYRAIPVVAGWESVKKVAKEKGFIFNTPSRPDLRPRNPENGGAAYADAFRAFAAGQAEWFQEESDSGMLTVIRPVKLTAGCLQCHGDPKTSPTGNGLDPVGMPMEGMHEGDIKGAFVLRAPITRDAVVMASIGKMALVGFVVLLVVVAVSFVLNQKWVVEPLQKVVQTLNDGAHRIGGASHRLGSTSQTLAEGATEQSAAVHESVASSEEIAVTTQQNAERSGSVARMITEFSDRFSKVNAQVASAVDSMKEINSSAGRISHIIKTIDGIAFQTNILALNAAVEAARAGEAGLGFAVVAEEVRTLSQRSSEAAKDTETLIAESLAKSKEGDSRLAEVASSIVQVAKMSAEVDRLIAEVSSSNREISNGVDQVSRGMQEIATATERAAAGAAENQSASTALNEEVEALQGAVSTLRSLI